MTPVCGRKCLCQCVWVSVCVFVFVCESRTTVSGRSRFPDFSIFPCGRTMSRRAHRLRILRLSVFLAQIRGIAQVKISVKFLDIFLRPVSIRLSFFACSYYFFSLQFLFDATSTYTYVRTSFSGLRRCVCVFRSSSSDARDPVVVVVCFCGFV